MDDYYQPSSQPDHYHLEQQQTPPARRYQIREKIFSFGDNFKIKDAKGEPVFIVQSKLFTFGDNLMLEDMAGKYVFVISDYN